MKNAKVLALICGVMIVSSFHQETFAQFQQLPIPQKEITLNPIRPNLKTRLNPLSIPFWDDFSSGRIDTTKWENEGVTHSFTVGNAPPSMGVILLDGVDESGKPYSSTPVEQGPTDRITSYPIDLGGLNSGESNTVFLSFHWQAGGKAEVPDIADELSLHFLSSGGTWDEVWNISGDLEEQKEIFTYEIIQVSPAYQHDGFRFRFQTRGRRSGPFDSWILDYVFLNKDRSPNDLFFEDRSLTQVNSSPFEKYSAVPLFELQQQSENYFGTIRNEFKNLNNRFRAMEYTIEIRESASQNIIQKINNNTPFNPVPLALERRTFSSNPIPEIPLPESETDWEIVSYLSSGDDIYYNIAGGDSVFFEQVDFRINDTVKTALPLRDFFAYDDGSADYSAGINQRSGMLALRYEMSAPAFINGVSINFTNFNQVGRAVELMVWNDLDEEPLFVKEVIIPEKGELSDLSYFALDTSIRVNKEFYVGFRQFSTEFIYVGLDKARDTGDEIYYNVSGSWQQNEFVSGSLMIRPHLSLEGPAPDESILLEMKVYPNPVQDKLFVEGKFENMDIFDSFGRRLNLPIEDYEKGKILNFVGLQKGIYIINILQGGKQKSMRILLKQ